MSDQINVFSAFHPEGNIAALEPGDVALVLKKDGSISAMNFGYDVTRLRLADEAKTELDHVMAIQGKKLFALSLAASNEQLMDMLLSIAADPEVVDFAKLAEINRSH